MCFYMFDNIIGCVVVLLGCFVTGVCVLLLFCVLIPSFGTPLAANVGLERVSCNRSVICQLDPRV